MRSTCRSQSTSLFRGPRRSRALISEASGEVDNPPYLSSLAAILKRLSCHVPQAAITPITTDADANHRLSSIIAGTAHATTSAQAKFQAMPHLYLRGPSGLCPSLSRISCHVPHAATRPLPIDAIDNHTFSKFTVSIASTTNRTHASAHSFPHLYPLVLSCIYIFLRSTGVSWE